jgi:hypothetical protein
MARRIARITIFSLAASQVGVSPRVVSLKVVSLKVVSLKVVSLRVVSPRVVNPRVTRRLVGLPASLRGILRQVGRHRVE